ncbi:double zinc ribbon domain-containing protein [Neorickettsia helminthoeca]|uniref:double zinc ribbon domain-containing protein n=1 Tax=Neorickettsia helminthoeca TaxID=33994 RepID=UPI000685AA57|nr:double zinc ribbon domain-containing protein [Neorickettsia helminthoeca]
MLKKSYEVLAHVLFPQVKTLVHGIFRFLFPDFCIVCSAKENLSEDNICGNCRSEVLFLEDFPHCYGCGRKMKNPELCIICEISKPKFDDVKAAFLYNKYVAHFIRKIKFHDGTFPSKVGCQNHHKTL